MTATETWAARTEVQVVADALWALLEAGLIPRDVHTVKRACDAVGVAWTEVRAAQARAEHRAQRPPQPEPVRPGATEPDPSRPGRPGGHVRRAPVGPVTTEHHVARRIPPPDDNDPRPDVDLGPGHSGMRDRKCRRCRETKPLEEFPLRKGALAGRSQWCRPCSDVASTRVVEQLRAGELALVRLALHEGDEAIGMECEECSRALRAGDVMVVGSKPRHDRCPT